jgi:hypothetical protein
MPRSAMHCSTRRTSPATSTGRRPISSGIPSRSILSFRLAPTGGQQDEDAKTNAPCSLRSRLRPSPCRGSPFPVVHQNVTAVCSRNRSVVLAGRVRFNKHPHHSLEFHNSQARGNGQEKESHQNILRNVLRRLLSNLGTHVSVRFCTFLYPDASWSDSRLKGALTTARRIGGTLEKNQVAELDTLSNR